jgi:hypothetical protein
VRWRTMKRWWKTTADQGASQELPSPTVTVLEAAQIDDCVTEHSARTAPARSSRRRSVRTSERTRVWRRRALLRKGARLYSTMTARSGLVSLAMLDEDGVVVAWFEPSADRHGAAGPPIQGHVSQLYMPEDIALGIPVRDLCTATVHGSCAGSGWRRGADGVKFWGSVVIKPILLRDGRLQGFSHTTHRAAAPWGDHRSTHEGSWKWLGALRIGSRQALRRIGTDARSAFSSSPRRAQTLSLATVAPFAYAYACFSNAESSQPLA